MRVSLEFTVGEGTRIDLRGVLPETVLGHTESEISRLPVRLEGRKVPLGEVCRVYSFDSEADELLLHGTTQYLDHVGCNMQSGRLCVDGDCGWGAGDGMRGGTLEVRGKTGDSLGMSIQGGLIHVTGNVGDWCGAAEAGEKKGMTGGIILADGDAGKCVGAGMRSGLIWVGGQAGDYCAWRMLAGTVMCRKGVGKFPGAGMKRGSLVTARFEGTPLGFRAAGKPDPAWLRLYLRALEKMGVQIPSEWIELGLHRYTGDHLEIGKGEILVYE